MVDLSFLHEVRLPRRIESRVNDAATSFWHLSFHDYEYSICCRLLFCTI
jgi:hypothetical protein